MITLFKNFADTTAPKYVTIDYVLDSIKNCKIQKQIDELRLESDKKKRSELKKMLPCILFAGKFSKRADKAILEHSGFVPLDWDNVEDLELKKSEIIKHPFIYACFISPSGNGLKAVAKIPKDIEKHRGYYAGLVRVFPELDATSKNESRICYASCDKDIYINPNAIEFDGYVDIKELQKMPLQELNKKTFNDYSKASVALKLIRDSVDGQKHNELLKASKLMGGFIAGGIIDEYEAIRLLETEILNKGVDDFEGAKITIRDGIAYGKNEPIQEAIKNDYVPKTDSVINLEDEDYSFVAKKEDIDEYINQWVNGTFEMGLSTGLPSLDKYFVFKRGNYNVINGFDNVGKSTALWYLCLLSAMYNNWSWIIYSNENRSGSITKKLLEFYWGESIKKLQDSQIKQGREFIDKHFTIISNDFMFNYKDVLNIATKLSKKKKYDGLLVDPYNSLKIDLSSKSKLSTHEYHYEAASEMQIYTKKNDMCIYLNCHVITGAMRLQKGETKHRAPQKADTEGGGKFGNKADDFMTFHREVQDPENFTKMEIHVRKIKETETGGGYTPYDQPYILNMQKGMCSYADLDGFNPVAEYWKRQGKQYEMKPNEDFLYNKLTVRQNVDEEDPF
jgi:hypothetical protein